MLFALQKPVFVGSKMASALGNRSAHVLSNSRLPSVEPLSTRMNSLLLQVCLASDSKHSSSSRSPFQLTTMMEMRGSVTMQRRIHYHFRRAEFCRQFESG